MNTFKRLTPIFKTIQAHDILEFDAACNDAAKQGYEPCYNHVRDSETGQYSQQWIMYPKIYVNDIIQEDNIQIEEITQHNPQEFLSKVREMQEESQKAHKAEMNKHKAMSLTMMVMGAIATNDADIMISEEKIDQSIDIIDQIYERVYSRLNGK